MTTHSLQLIGCGALAEQVYAPVLTHLEKSGRVRVTALVDPSAPRRAQLAKFFPAAQASERVEDLPATLDSLAVIASPPSFHAAQACALLANGHHVLCEKPLAASVAEAEGMVAAAQAAGRLLAAGMMRRFYPAAQALRENIQTGFLGEAQVIEVVEGGRFGWNAASPNFFSPKQGGVLYDLGSHVLDLLCHWFGEPVETTAQLDTLGGTNTNGLLTGRWAGGFTARVRLSWDTPLDTGWRIATSRGECRWDGSCDGLLTFQPRGGSWWLQAHAVAQPDNSFAPIGWTGAFVRQFENVLGAIEGKNLLLAPAVDILPSLRWLQAAQSNAQFMPQPWLGSAELAGASLFKK